MEWRKHKSQWPHPRGIKFPSLLIGIDYADLHSSRKEILGRPGQPVARLTPLGWTCIGNLSPEAQNHCGFFHTYFQNTVVIENDSEINVSIRKFWEVEEVQTADAVISPENRVVIEKVRQSMNYKDGMYKVEIPWKDGIPSLPNDYEMAVRRLENTEKCLDRSPEVKTLYQGTIRQYLDKGYVHKVADPCRDDKAWYLLHFLIVCPDKSTTKVRIVFDASATFKGTSLNQSIHQGPKLQRELPDVLLRFRRNPLALICDISEMYLLIKIAAEDRNPSHTYKPSVANRMGEIQRLTNPDQWKYVPTKQNPADIASRGISVSKLACGSLWLNGPEFLTLPRGQWPN